MTIWQQRLKRLIDITCAAAGLALTLPVQIAVACAIRITIGRPILFRQVRVGRDAELFTLVKFRTMRDVSSSEGLLSDEDRLTRLGRLLRSSSVDELPTLWNVLRGDMRLVGPRPLLPVHRALYNARQAMRHTVRPAGIG